MEIIYPSVGYFGDKTKDEQMSLDVRLSVLADTGGEHLTEFSIYSSNITHNLNKMATAVGFYHQIWRPDECGIEFAGDLADILESGLQKLKQDPEFYKSFNSENGWGEYEGFVKFVEEYAAACKVHPKALVSVTR